jgi:uncharacterized protein YjbI with pentapeptide repeats
MGVDTHNFETKQAKIAESELVTQLQKEFSKIAEISDPLAREYNLIRGEQDAALYGLSQKSYRRLFKVYLQNRNHILPFQKRWWNRRQIQLTSIGKAFSLVLEKGFLLAATVGLGIYIWEVPLRQKQAHYQDWQILNSATAQVGSGGRIEALEDLNNDGVSLNGLIAKGANLSGIQLQKADLRFANLQNTNLTCRSQKANVNTRICSNLQGANLVGVNFQGANLVAVNFQGADLENANLETVNLIKANLKAANLFGANIQSAKLLLADLKDANLLEANLQAARLQGTNLQKANLFGANLQAANLKTVNFTGANLQASNLTDADLKDANLQGADLTGANLTGADLTGAKELTPEQVKAAKNWEKAHYNPELSQKLGLLPQVSKTQVSKTQVSKNKVKR